MQFIDLKKQYELIEDKIKAGIHGVLEHGQYIMGPEVSALERKLETFVGVSHAIAVSSGTDALLLALMALDIGPGDEVITTPFSFFATVEVICLLGAKPVFVDIEADTYNINTSLIEAAITNKTKAIMPVSLYGQCADMSEINAIAEQYNLTVIEDGAQSFGALYQGNMSGNLSKIGATSFFPSKPLGAYGDAGACFTNDAAIAEKIRALLAHGQGERYIHKYIGINARMDSIQAAILNEKLTLFANEKLLRQKAAENYQTLLQGIANTQTIREDRDSVYAQFTIEVDDRAKIQAALKDKGIPSAVHYPMPLHAQPALRHLNLTDEMFPVTKAASDRVISLPMHPYLEKKDQEIIISALQAAIEGNKA